MKASKLFIQNVHITFMLIPLVGTIVCVGEMSRTQSYA